jgi:hypothetical protein
MTTTKESKAQENAAKIDRLKTAIRFVLDDLNSDLDYEARIILEIALDDFEPAN